MPDSIDLKILSTLQQHGRRHLAEIAKEVDLSAPAVMERVKKLEAKGIIKGYYALLDPKKVGKNITAFVSVSIGHQRYSEGFSIYMAAKEDVLECHHVTGDESFILKVKTADTASLERLLAEIRSMEGVSRTVTKVVLSTSKEGHTLGLSERAEGALIEGGGEGGNREGKRALAGTWRKR